jgi:hypothetical protein
VKIRRIALLGLLALVCSGAHAQTPTIRQFTNGPGVNNATATTYVCRLDSVSLASNYLFAVFNTATGNTGGSVADDKGNTWTRVLGAAGNQRIEVFQSPGAAAGTQRITYTPSTGVNNIQGGCGEAYNVATSSPVDGTACSGTSAGATAVACSAAITTTVSGDLVLQYGVQDSGIGMTSWTHGSSPWLFANAGADIQIGQALQAQVQPSSGAITPSMTQAPSHAFDTIGWAVKAAAAGTAPTGMYVEGLEHANISGAAATPVKVPFPCTNSNTIVVRPIFIDALTITGITDTVGNTYTAAAAQISNTGSGQVRVWVAAGASCSQTNVLSLAFTGANSSGQTAIVEGVVGAASSPVDTSITCGSSTHTGNSCQTTGSDATAGSHSLATVTIVPSTSSGLVFASVGLTNPEPCNASATGLLTAMISTPEASSADMDENNCWNIDYNASNASRTYNFTMPNGGAGNWAAYAIALTAPASGSTPAISKRTKLEAIE